jgi:hypothetical protein
VGGSISRYDAWLACQVTHDRRWPPLRQDDETRVLPALGFRRLDSGAHNLLDQSDSHSTPRRGVTVRGRFSITMQHPVCVQVRAHQAQDVAPDIHSQVEGRGPEILRALDIRWRPGRGQIHIHCPLRSHADRNPSWRWDDRKERWFCSCGSGNIVDLVIAMLGSDFVTAAAWIRREALCISSIEPNSRVAQIEVEVGKREVRQLELERQDAEHQAQRRRVGQAIYGRSLPGAGSIICIS